MGQNIPLSRCCGYIYTEIFLEGHRCCLKVGRASLIPHIFTAFVSSAGSSWLCSRQFQGHLVYSKSPNRTSPQRDGLQKEDWSQRALPLQHCKTLTNAIIKYQNRCALQLKVYLRISAKKEYNLVYLNLRPKWTSESKRRGQLADFALKLALGLYCREEKKKEAKKKPQTQCKL